jgi:hypothetical protein
MTVHSIRDLCRREILMMAAVLAGSGVVFSPKRAAAEAALQRTPDQILGPFYPLSDLATFRRKKPFSDDRATKLGARTRRQVAADKL